MPDMTIQEKDETMAELSGFYGKIHNFNNTIARAVDELVLKAVSTGGTVEAILDKTDIKGDLLFPTVAALKEWVMQQDPLDGAAKCKNIDICLAICSKLSALETAQTIDDKLNALKDFIVEVRSEGRIDDIAP